MNVHDYVGEMVVGTWVRFDRAEGAIDARLTWVSPLRAKYIFTSRSRSHAFILTPEELAWQLGSGTARLVVGARAAVGPRGQFRARHARRARAGRRAGPGTPAPVPA